jgi:signal transduction histidine kinase
MKYFKPKDSRINTVYLSIKDYLLLFFALAAFNGFHMVIFQEFVRRGIMETHIQVVINIFMGYVFFTAALFTALIGIVRYTSWNRPMRRLGEAARKISKGDFSVRIAPLRKDGKKDFVEVMFDDFNTMAGELESIETLKTDFIANVSHEIKTPLSVIQGYAHILQDDTLSLTQRREYAKTILEATQRLSALISNILKLNKLENQEIIPETKQYSLSEQLRRCALAFEDLWERKHINFDADLDELTISNDETMLETVWNNLLSNAIKFTGSGGNILLTLKEQDGCAVVSIKDSGCGMNTETQRRIFDKFYQGDSSHSQEGNGLGLALAKQAVELSGGTIGVESEPGCGSKFRVCFKI